MTAMEYLSCCFLLGLASGFTHACLRGIVCNLWPPDDDEIDDLWIDESEGPVG